MDSVTEIWKSVNEFPFYEVSNLGRVRSLERTLVRSDGRIRRWPTKVLSLQSTTRGYRTVKLYANGSSKSCIVHVLVAKHFIGPRPEGLVINHKDRDKLNNHVDNLEYITNTENIIHGFEILSNRPKSGPRTKPERIQQVKIAHALLTRRMPVKEIAELVGMSEVWVYAVGTGRIGKDLGLPFVPPPIRRKKVS